MASTVQNAQHNGSHGRVWHFADCQFDELRHELRVRGAVVELESKPLEVLHQLLLSAGDVVSKEDLLQSVWPGVLVVDASLATAVSKLRKALDDDAVIKTVPKVGYRISVPVRLAGAKDDSGAPEANDAAPSILDHETRLRGLLMGRNLAWAFAITVVVALSVSLTAFRRSTKGNLIPGPVAILPFQNIGADPNLDYLRSALPDEVSHSLSAAKSLIVRPIPLSSRYSDPSIDLRQAARELNVSRLITGHYVLAGDQLQITMEAIDTDENRVLWHDTVSAPAKNLIALRSQVAATSRRQLAGALGIREFVTATDPQPANEEAYELYLKSLALDGDPEPNKEGITLLRRAVLLDPNYAPAWGTLALRYYTESRFGGGGPDMLELSDAAAERAVALDPDGSDMAAELTLHRAERGQIVKAHQQALELLRHRPDNPNTHHVLSYVLRYGGSIEEAGRECEITVLLATKVVWGSCAITFTELGNYQRARDFIRKDLSSEWSKARALDLLLREGKTQEAIKIEPPKIPHWDSYKMLLACARHEPELQIRALAAGVEVDDDPEVDYFFAAHLAYCGQTDAANRMLKVAIERNYCSYPTMDKDPFFDKMRNNPAFLRVRAEGIACHENFVANRELNPVQERRIASR